MAVEDRANARDRSSNDARAVPAFGSAEEQYRLLAETASDIVYAVGGDRVVTWVAPSITRALGWQPDELVGTIMSDLVHPDDLAWSAERRDRLYAGDPDAEAEGSFLLRMRAKDGRYHWVKTTLTTHRDAAGEPVGFTGGMVLVDDLVAAREEVVEAERLRQLMADAMDDAQVLLEPLRDPDGAITDFRILFANRKACSDYGLPVAQVVGSCVSVLDPALHTETFLAACRQASETHHPASLEGFDYRLPSTGEERIFDTRVVPVPGGLVTAVWRDVTEEYLAAQQIAESEARFRLLAENVSDVVQLARDGACIWVSPSVSEALGWQPAEWVQQGFAGFVHPDDLDAMRTCQQQVEGGQSKMIDLRVRHRDGDYRWIQISAAPFDDGSEGGVGIVSSFRLIDEQVAAREELEHRATYDDLTGALKREPALRKLERSFASRRHGSDDGLALLFVDVDEFKGVNDTHGHATGDRLLQAIVARTAEVVRDGDAIARLGGDEFMVMLEGVHTEAEAGVVAEKIRTACAAPVETPAGLLAITLSIGIVLREDEESVDDLIARADRAMYRAKRAGRDRVEVADGG